MNQTKRLPECICGPKDAACASPNCRSFMRSRPAVERSPSVTWGVPDDWRASGGTPHGRATVERLAFPGGSVDLPDLDLQQRQAQLWQDMKTIEAWLRGNPGRAIRFNGSHTEPFEVAFHELAKTIRNTVT